MREAGGKWVNMADKPRDKPINQIEKRREGRGIESTITLFFMI